MNKRNQNAVACQQGACNPIPIINALKEGLDELRAENADTPTILGDPALRLIVHQLAWLMHTHQLDALGEVYSQLCAQVGMPD